MSDESNGVAAERYAIGVSFGNSTSSIARTSPVCSDDVIAVPDMKEGLTVVNIGGEG